MTIPIKQAGYWWFEAQCSKIVTDSPFLIYGWFN